MYCSNSKIKNIPTKEKVVFGSFSFSFKCLNLRIDYDDIRDMDFVADCTNFIVKHLGNNNPPLHEFRAYQLKFESILKVKL